MIVLVTGLMITRINAQTLSVTDTTATMQTAYDLPIIYDSTDCSVLHPPSRSEQRQQRVSDTTKRRSFKRKQRQQYNRGLGLMLSKHDI